MIVAPLIVALLILTPYIIFVTYTPPEAIEIDGRFGDWVDVVMSTDAQEVTPFNTNVDIIDYRVDDRQLELSFYLEVVDEMLAGEPDAEKHVDTAYIFIDTDRSPDSGYYILGIGADYMVEVYGWNGEVLSSALYSYIGEEQDWNLWIRTGGIAAKASGSELEAKVSHNALYLHNHDAVDVLFYMQSWDGSEDFSDTVISNEKGVLSVEQQGVGEDVISGNDSRLLRLNLKALNADITVSELRAARTGNGSDDDVGEIRLEDENTNTIVTGSISNDVATFQPNLMLSEGQSTTLYIVVDVASGAVAENTIGFKIENNHDIVTDKGTVSVRRVAPETN